MSVLGFLALFGGLVQVPGVTEVITHFLEPTFEDSPLAAMHPSTSEAWKGLIKGGIISIVGIAFTWWLYIGRPSVPATLRRTFSPVYTLFINKWYGDEVIEFLIVRPVKGLGKFANQAIEPFVINGLTGGTIAIVRSTGAAVRDFQTGMIRSYAVMMLTGIVAIVLYFLIRGL
jgi:NADH-quinone oxidoreductase subunit L